jgi:hypothetical protein
MPFRLVAANSARDVGGRLAAMSIWGMKASGGKYAALAALTNIPAMLFAAALYEFFLTDSLRGLIDVLGCTYRRIDRVLLCLVVPRAQMEFMTGHQKHQEQLGVHQKLSGSSRKQASLADAEKEGMEGMENLSRA